MALVRWNPFQELELMQDRINRLFNDTFRTSGRGEDQYLSAWAPKVNIYEDKDHISIEADLPGMEQKDIDVKIENNVLSIRGERKLEREDKRDGYHRIEKSYGGFVRSFELPSTVDPEKVDASYQKGVLRLRLPKREEAKPKQISVKVQ